MVVVRDQVKVRASALVAVWLLKVIITIQGGSIAHCDRPGYPSCSGLGSAAGKGPPGTSCPPGHSKAFCSSYAAAAGSSDSNMPSISSHEGITAHCNVSGYLSCYSLGYVEGQNHLGAGCPNGHSPSFCAGWNSGAANTAHCDQSGWPSCYSLGYKAGSIAPGTSCPAGHTLAFCNGYEYASGGSSAGYTQGIVDPTHCDQPGLPACYNIGYHDGYNNAVNEHHQFRISCPLGHSKAFCKGYVPGYNRGISYNLGFSQGVNNADHDWNSSSQDIHAFTYDCPTGHTKDFCNGYTDGYGDEVNDILG